MRTCRTEILLNVNSRRRCNSGNVPLSLSPSSPPLSLSLSLSTAAPHLPFFCHVPTRGIYVALSSRELSKGNLLADNGNTRQRVRFDAFVSKRAEPKVYNAGSLDADTNLVLNGHVPSSISLQCSFFSPLSSSLSLSLHHPPPK